MKNKNLIRLALKESFPKTGVLITYTRHRVLCLSVHWTYCAALSPCWVRQVWGRLSLLSSSLCCSSVKSLQYKRVFPVNIAAIRNWKQKWIYSFALGRAEMGIIFFVSMSVLYSSGEWRHFNEQDLSIISVTLKYKNVAMSTFFLSNL